MSTAYAAGERFAVWLLGVGGLAFALPVARVGASRATGTGRLDT